MANLNLTRSEFADLVVAFLFDTMVNPDDIIIENEKFHELINKIARMGAKPLFMKYYLDMTADDRLSYKKLKRTLETGGTVKSSIQVKPSVIKAEPKKSGLANLAKKVVKKLLLQQNVTPDELQLLKEYMEVEEDNG